MFSLSFLLLPFMVHAEEFNAGIVQGLWYAHEEVFADTPTRIYVAIRNNTGSDLNGIVEFFDGEKKIGRKNVQALDGRIIESWSDWNPSYGDHTLRATLVRTQLSPVGGASQEVEVTSAIAEDTLFVDYDTDKDGIGNETDLDDDNDGIRDQEEEQAGTDPLVKNNTEAEEDEAEEDETERETEKDEDESDSTGIPEGLERYLTNSPAENVLTSFSSVLTEVKEDIDSYRTERKEKKEAAKTQKDQAPDGFGEVTRSTSTEGTAMKQLSLADFFASVWHLAKTIFDLVYTFVLALLSFVLGKPMLVQLGVLILILVIVMKLASKFGRRPKMKKI